MASPKLTSQQRATLLEWIAADYDWRLIRGWFKDNDWPEISRANVTYYRKHYKIDLDKIRSARYEKALDSGLAKRAERVERLKKHADELEELKWVPDKNGRLWNEKAWREVLDQIAGEMGDKKNIVSGDDEHPIKQVIEVVYSDSINAAAPASGADEDQG